MTTAAQAIQDFATPEQRAKISTLLSAPAMKWKVTKVLRSKFLFDGRIAVQIEAKGCWGVILPSGEMVRPKPGRSSIDNLEIANHL